MRKSRLLSLACVLVLIVGCTDNKSHDKSQKEVAAAKFKARSGAQSSGQSSALSRADAEWAGGAPTAAPTNAASVAHPLAGAWELAVPRRRMSDASIRATDETHVTINAGNNGLSGDYVQQGNFLLILTSDERFHQIAWKINSNDSLTLIRATDYTGAPSRFIGTTLLRAPDADAMTETDTGDVFAQ